MKVHMILTLCRYQDKYPENSFSKYHFTLVNSFSIESFCNGVNILQLEF